MMFILSPSGCKNFPNLCSHLCLCLHLETRYVISVRELGKAAITHQGKSDTPPNHLAAGQDRFSHAKSAPLLMERSSLRRHVPCAYSYFYYVMEVVRPIFLPTLSLAAGGGPRAVGPHVPRLRSRRIPTIPPQPCFPRWTSGWVEWELGRYAAWRLLPARHSPQL